jgi:L-methionine (R)-S-oxide reductase
MAEEFKNSGSTEREIQYKSLIPQIERLVRDEPDLIANLAIISATIKEEFGFLWVGFYLKKGEELVLGPFQGPVACTRISLSRGVCGAAFTSKSTVIVDDVDQFPDHIACSSLSRSEIVIPIFHPNGSVSMVLDIDSKELNHFSELDKKYLEDLASQIQELL